MIQRMSPNRRRLAILAAVCGSYFLPMFAQAEPTPGKNDGQVAQIVCEFLHQGHLTKPDIGVEISRRLFHKFLKDLDPGKLYFLQSDIDEFQRSETSLGEALTQGDMSFAYKV